jgi:hypothetical protein
VCYGRDSARHRCAGSPVPLSGITQGLSGSNAGGVFCALPSMPMSVGITSAAGAIPSLGNAASAVPSAGNGAGSATGGNGSLTDTVGNLVPGNGPGGLNSVNGITGGGQSGSQAGGPATGPLP